MALTRPTLCRTLPFVSLALTMLCARGHAQSPTPDSTAAEAPQRSEEMGPGEGGTDPMGAPEARPEGEALIVTAKRPARTAFDAPAAINVVDGRRLRELQPRQTAEALRNQPGVWVQRTGHGGGAPIVRGFMGNRVLYLFDGIRRSTASIFGGPNGFLNNSDPMTIRRVEVIRGPSSVLYGSDAIGGVINVITAHPVTFESGGPRYTGELRGGYQTVDGTFATGFEAGLLTERLLLNVGGGYTDIGDVTGGGDAGVLKPSTSNHRAVDVQAAYRITPRDTLEALAQFFERPEGTRFDRPSQRRSSQRQMYVLRYRGEKHGVFRRLFAEAYVHLQAQDTGDVKKPDKLKENRDNTVGGELRATSRIGSAAVTYGLHYHHDQITSEKPKRDEADPEVAYDNLAAYALGQLFPTARLTLEASLRFDYMRLSSTAPAAGTGVPLGLDAADLEIDRGNTAFTGGVGATYAVTDWLNWVAHAGTAFRAPSKSDLLRVGQFSFGYGVPPGEDLKPETAFSVETGVRTDHRRFESAANVFYIGVRDVMVNKSTTFKGSPYVDSDEDGNTGEAEDNDGDDQSSIDEEVYAKANEDAADAFGVELAFRAWLTAELALYHNSTVMWGTQGEDDRPLDRAIPPNATLGLRWQDARFEPRFFVEVEGFGAAPFDRIDPNRAKKDSAFKIDPQDKNSESILMNGTTMPPFLVANLRAGASLAEHVDLTLGLENLFDSRYRVKDSRIDAPGFNAQVGVRGYF